MLLIVWLQWRQLEIKLAANDQSNSVSFSAMGKGAVFCLILNLKKT
jgi:hypothetical protein